MPIRARQSDDRISRIAAQVDAEIERTAEAVAERVGEELFGDDSRKVSHEELVRMTRERFNGIDPQSGMPWPIIMGQRLGPAAALALYIEAFGQDAKEWEAIGPEAIAARGMLGELPHQVLARKQAETAAAALAALEPVAPPLTMDTEAPPALDAAATVGPLPAL